MGGGGLVGDTGDSLGDLTAAGSLATAVFWTFVWEDRVGGEWLHGQMSSPRDTYFNF